MNKDYIAQVKIRNGPMLRAMRLAGYHTAADVCRADPRLTPSSVGEINNCTVIENCDNG